MMKKQQRAQAKSKTRDESEPNSLETSENSRRAVQKETSRRATQKETSRK
jgi:hypothetical protein